MAYISLTDIVKEYSLGEIKIKALDGCSFEVERGEFVVILGPSGAGKTTVLNILGGMDGCDGGSVSIDDLRIDTYSKKELVKYRRFDVGFVFQFYNLIQNLTALENVELAAQLNKDALNSEEIMELVGLKDRMENFPAQLSGGEQQRVAIARAIAKNPKLLLCDEPTGALDSITGKRIIGLLKDMSRQLRMTTIVITHNAVIAEVADKIIRMRNGKVEETILQANPKEIEEIDW
ncbi:MAG: ABC transporter ATP-binding protein [Christensenellaceae bacterium]|jgi:putative ABC transport system ATP-binding protein